MKNEFPLSPPHTQNTSFPHVRSVTNHITIVEKLIGFAMRNADRYLMKGLDGDDARTIECAIRQALFVLSDFKWLTLLFSFQNTSELECAISDGSNVNIESLV
jgi:hypothetical protein